MSATSIAIAQTLAKKGAAALYHVLKGGASSNTDAANQEYREALDAMTIAMASKYDWGPVPDDEKPTAEDAAYAARGYTEEYERATGPKRRLLRNAFFGYFNPKFYRSGMSKILWDYAVQLEYPDAEFLRRAVEAIRTQMQGRSEQTQLIETGAGARRVWTTTEFPVNCTSVDYELALRLKAKGFVRFIPSNSDYYIRVAPKLDLVEQLMEFVWGEEEVLEVPNEPAEAEPEG